VWVYYSGLIVIFGAELTRVTARHAGRQIRPAEDAMRVDRPSEQENKREMVTV